MKKTTVTGFTIGILAFAIISGCSKEYQAERALLRICSDQSPDGLVSTAQRDAVALAKDGADIADIAVKIEHLKWCIGKGGNALQDSSIKVGLSMLENAREKSDHAARGEWAAAEAQERARAERCSTGLDGTVSAARSLMKAGEPGNALQLLAECRDNGQAMQELINQATKALEKKTADAEKAEFKSALAEVKREVAAKKKAGVSIGMNAQDVRDSSWGKPRSINRTSTAHGDSEQWVYNGNYLYFTNGVLTAIQN